MAETTYKQWLAKKKKSELVDLVYELHLQLVDSKHFEMIREALDTTEGLE